MKRQFCFIALLLMGAALTGIFIGLAASRAPVSDSISTDAERFQPEQHQAVPPNSSKTPQVDQAMEYPKAQVSSIHSDPAGTPVNGGGPVAGNALSRADELEFYKIAETNPAAAVALAAKLDPAQRPKSLMEDLVQKWADADLLSAAAWVELNASGDERDRELQRVGFTLSQGDPAEAAEFVMSQISVGSVQDEAVMTVVNQWGNKNLAAAASWVQTLPEGPLQERAVNELEGIENYQRELARQ
jgi:hypothetical protein